MHGGKRAGAGRKPSPHTKQTAILPVRLKEEDIASIRAWAQMEDMTATAFARKLIEEGLRRRQIIGEEEGN